MTAPAPIRALGACLALGVTLSGCSDGAARDDTALSTELTCGPATVVAILPESIIEASGIARDPRRDDLYWLHNDGGKEAILFGVDTTGVVLATVRISGPSPGAVRSGASTSGTSETTGHGGAAFRSTASPFQPFPTRILTHLS